jgi:hypothetical protein
MLRISNIPGLSRTYHFSDVKSVEILTCVGNKKAELSLCLQIAGRRTLIRLVQSWCHQSYVEEALATKYEPMAELIAGKIGVPVHVKSVSPLGSWRIWGR